VRLLLDTHTLLWRIDDPTQLAEEARLAIANGRNSVFMSPISILEIVIKQATGKLRVPATLLTILEACRFAELALSIAHAAEVQELPPIHKDPFDRTLIAQARVEGLTLVSRDAQLSRYDVALLTA
jgi:PIN domain nuclease of toxin-antitoxin system